MGEGCRMGWCHRCHGVKLFIVGLLILANVYWINWPWWTFVGALFVLGGLVKMAWPTCGHCKAAPVVKGKK
jgi:uncharacterized membrane protein YjjB (DUF3815 family)